MHRWESHSNLAEEAPGDKIAKTILTVKVLETGLRGSSGLWSAKIEKPSTMPLCPSSSMKDWQSFSLGLDQTVHLSMEAETALSSFSADLSHSNV